MSKISDLPVLTDAHGGAYIPVVWNGQNMRIYLSTIAASVENFTPYDPAATYSNTGPDYVSYNNSIYEYIGAAPATGVLPTTETHWIPASAGRLTHVQNTDTHTTSPTFEFGKKGTELDEEGDPVENPHMLIVLKLGKTAIRQIGEPGVFPDPPTFKLQYTNNYTGTGSDVWEDFDLSNVARLDAENVFTEPQYIETDSPFGLTLINATTGVSYFEAAKTGYLILRSAAGVSALLRAQAADLLSTDGKFNAVGGLQNKGADLIAPKTGTHIDFRAMTTHFGSLAAAETGNYTADLTGAVIGHVAVSFHNSGTEPTFITSGVTFNKVGTKAYALGATNRILFHFVGSSTIDYMIQ